MDKSSWEARPLEGTGRQRLLSPPRGEDEPASQLRPAQRGPNLHFPYVLLGVYFEGHFVTSVSCFATKTRWR
jgi:hypothetical protein